MTDQFTPREFPGPAECASGAFEVEARQGAVSGTEESPLTWDQHVTRTQTVSGVIKFTPWRQRVALAELASDISFLESAEGAALVEQLRVFLAPLILKYAYRLRVGQDWLDVEDVVNGAIEFLSQNGGNVAARAAASDGDPFGYVYACMKRWAGGQWGSLGRTLDGLEELIAAPEGISTPDRLTPLDEVVDLTFHTLSVFVANNLHDPLLNLIGWLAANPPQRLSYEGFEKRAAHRHCHELTPMQVDAVMNVCWGGRPRSKETSLFGQFLLQPDFRPASSPTHARALNWFRKQWIASLTPASLTTDWK